MFVFRKNVLKSSFYQKDWRILWKTSHRTILNFVQILCFRHFLLNFLLFLKKCCFESLNFNNDSLVLKCWRRKKLVSCKPLLVVNQPL